MGLSQVVQTIRGSRAGNTLGDLIFIVGMVRVFTTLCVQLAGEGLLSQVETAPAVQVFGKDFVWRHEGETRDIIDNLDIYEACLVDDVAIPIIDISSNIIGKVISAVDIVDFTFQMYGFAANFSEDKTEVLFKFNGGGTFETRHNLFNNMNGLILFKSRGAPKE